MFDVYPSIQSYLNSVPRGLDVLTSDFSISRFVALGQSFGNAGISDVYCPWDTIDHFRRFPIREALDVCGTEQQAASDGSEIEGNTGVKHFEFPKLYKRRSHLLKEERELADSAPRLAASCSKGQLYYMYKCFLVYTSLVYTCFTWLY